MLRSTRPLTLLAALALAAPLAAVVGPAEAGPPAGSTSSDAASDPEPSRTPQAPAARAAAAAPFRLWAPRTVRTESYRGRAWTDLGLRLVAGDRPLELWSQRANYREPIRTVWRSPAGDVALPAGSMRDFSGLRSFLRLTFKPARGPATVLTRPACLNGFSERVRPTAPANSPYPAGCWSNPFSLGSVQGVQPGWASAVLTGERPLRLAPGRYRVTVEVSPRYAAAFGLSKAQATRQVRLIVRRESEDDYRTAPRRHGQVASPAPSRPTGAPTRDAAGPTPDLRSLPAWGISLSRNGRLLRFSATVWNAGDSPLVVDGFRRRGQKVMDAYQYFFDGDGQQTGYAPVGELHWDAKSSHQHWHFDDFARYSLLRRDRTEAARSKKEAFCLANTDAVDLTVPDAEWRPENTDLATSCGEASSLSIREVLAAGWGDTYTQMRAGQSFRVDGLPNGVYYVAVEANPDRNLVESDTGNNLALRRIRLGGTPAHRTLKVAKVGIVDDERYGGTG